jgi:hypothetical protein
MGGPKAESATRGATGGAAYLITRGAAGEAGEAAGAAPEVATRYPTRRAP